MIMKTGKIHYSKDIIDKLQNDPNVKCIRVDRLSFTYEFRVKMYDAIKDDISVNSIKSFLEDSGYSTDDLCYDTARGLAINFRRHGRPTNCNSDTQIKYDKTQQDVNFLVDTGKFEWCNQNHKQIRIKRDFLNELACNYPEQSVEEGLNNAGISINQIGYQRYYTIVKLITEDKHDTISYYSDEIIKKYSNHPYINNISTHRLSFTKEFYNQASSLIDLGTNDILQLYEFDPSDFTYGFKARLKFKLSSYEKRESVDNTPVTEQVIRIQYNRMKALERLVEDGICQIARDELPLMSHKDKRNLCIWVSGFNNLEYKPIANAFTITRVLSLLGISRSSYYSILKDEDYGEYEMRKEEQDLRDLEIIKQVMDYRGFRKGSRQIYMDMFDITGKQFSLKKIKRIMSKYNIQSGIREKKQSRIETRKLIDNNKKPNILKRRFKLYKPNMVRLTDVTYINYGSKRAYGSVVKDPVTCKIIDFTVSDSNDLSLVLKSLDTIINDEMMCDGAILHSDQGVLYLNPTFQQIVSDNGMIQSMSKRGNCWDNAPQESFFGHFKCEVDYNSCNTLEQLQQICHEYMHYYNNERRQWNLKRMTPIQYEEYMMSFDDEQYGDYFKCQQQKYDQMKLNAEKEAIERARCLGV